MLDLSNLGARQVFDNPHHTLTHLTRIAQGLEQEEGREWLRAFIQGDFEQRALVALSVAVETGDPIGQVLAGILIRKSLTPSLLQDLHAHLPDQSLALLEVAKIVTEQLLEHYRQQPGIRNQGRAANLTNDLASRLAALGQRKEALATARSAVRRFRCLARSQPRVFRPRLATALANLAENLLDCGRPKAALKASRKAEAIFVESEEPSALQRSHRAGAVLTRSRAHSDLGDYIAARKAAQQACELFDALDRLESGGYSYALAAAKHHLGLQQAQCGDLGASQKTMREAARLYQQLGDQRGDVHLPARAAVLPNLGAQFRQEGKAVEAAESTRQAIELYRTLAERSPSRFEPELAASLSNFSAMQWDLGESEEAAQAAQEAVLLFTKLAADEPRAFRNHYAAASVNLAIMFHQLGRHQEAVEAARRAVNAYKKLARSNPARFRPELATALCNITPILETAGQPREALRHAKWAVRIWRRRPFLLPNERHSLATLLYNLSKLLGAAGRHKKALAAAEEALEHCTAIQPTRAMVLNTLANTLAANDKHEEAVEAVKEALGLYEALTENNRKVFQPKRAAVRFNLSSRYREVGDLQQAAQMALEAIRDYCDLALHDTAFVTPLNAAAHRLQDLLKALTQGPAHHEGPRRLAREAVELFRSAESLWPQLAESLVALGSRLGELSRHDEGLEATREGVDLYRELAREDPEEFLLPLAGSLSNLGHRLRWLRRSGEALAHLQEAVDLYRQLDSERPDSIRPQLGPCLCNLSLALRDLGRLREALPLAEESIRFLTPLFLQSPEFFGEWMEEIEQQYRKTTEAAGSPPDPELLDPVRQALENRRPRGDRHREGARSP